MTFHPRSGYTASFAWSKEQLAASVLQTVEANELTDQEIVMRIIISGGMSGTLTLAKTPTIAIIVEPRIPERWYVRRRRGPYQDIFTRLTARGGYVWANN